MRPRSTDTRISIGTLRLDVWYGLILVIFALFIVRLFYIQVISHDKYKNAALVAQQKAYEIPAERGIIEAHDGGKVIPIVLNEEVYTLFADPKFIADPKAAALAVSAIGGGKSDEYESKMRSDTRYAVLAKRLNAEQKQKIEKLEIKGVGLRTESVRTYPQGSLAAQTLGFVNDEAKGTYGLEQYLNDRLSGKPGELKAITDARGVPLVGNGDNVLREPVSGERVLLTLDIGMQHKAEELLKSHLESVKSTSGSVIIMDPNSGAVKAIANYPSYNPAEFSKVTDASLFTNPAVSAPFEVGSIMKTLTVGAGLNEGVITPETTYFDPGYFKIDDATVKNVEEIAGSGTRSVADILRLSLNTGATYVFRQLGGGEFNEEGRIKWHDYMVNHYRFGKQTGIEQGYEAEGSVPSPTEGFGLNIQYANTAFGQGITITPLQLAAAFSASINGGTYYKPHLVEGEPVAVDKSVVKPEVSDALRALHENTIEKAYSTTAREGYKIGGKTGTAEIPNPQGGYYTDRYNGTFVGYVGGDKPDYVVMVRINEPHVAGYAGRTAAAPMFTKIINMLINDFSIRPKS